MGIRYHVNKQEFSAHPQIAADVAAASIAGVVHGKRGPALRRFEDVVERVYTQDLYNQCKRATEWKERRKEAEVGLFGIGTDWEKVRAIDTEVVESCEELKRLGLLR
jgi:DnaJ family protein B protein 12